MRRTLALALFTALALPGAGAFAESHPAVCTRGEDAATITNPQGGKLSVQHQAGAITLGTSAPTQGAVVSTTGTIKVEVKHSCMDKLRLIVKKDGAVIHDQVSDVECDKDLVMTQTVNIGMNGGEYTFELQGVTCDGRGIKGDGNGHYVVDPPLPAPDLRRAIA